MSTENPAIQLEGVRSVRQLISVPVDPPIQAVLDAGVLGRLIQLLATSPQPRLQFEAAWAITNIAATDHTNVVVEAGAILPLVTGMMNMDPDVRDQCIRCIGNIAGDCPKFRDKVLDARVKLVDANSGFGGSNVSAFPAINFILDNIQDPATPALLRNATWTLSRICKGKPFPSLTLTTLLAPVLAKLLGHSDREVVQDAAWGLSYLSDGNEAMVQAVLDAPGVVGRCVARMGHAEPTVVVPALRVVGNLISGSDAQTQAAVNEGALGALLPLLSHPRRNIKREAAWAVSNVAAGTSAQLSAVMAQPGLMAAVLILLGNGGVGGDDWNVRKEAAWVVNNVAAVGSLEQCGTLLGLGVSHPLTEVLQATRDARILGVVLDAVDALLGMWGKAQFYHVASVTGGWLAGERVVHDNFEEAGLLDALETVQQYAPEEIYFKCVALLTKHYPVPAGHEEDEETWGRGEDLPAVMAALAVHSPLPPPSHAELSCTFATPGTLPDALNIVEVTIPRELTGAYGLGATTTTTPLTFLDCMEKVVLRLLQLALLDTSPPPHHHSQPTRLLHLIRVPRVRELGGTPEALAYFTANPHALPSSDYHNTPSGMAARSSWAVLMSRHEGITYRHEGAFEMLPSALNFLNALHALFPRLHRHTLASREAFEDTAAFFSLAATPVLVLVPVPSPTPLLPPPPMALSWQDVEVSLPTTILRSGREARDKWMPVTDTQPAQHSRAMDQRSHATLCIGGKPCFYFHWFLRIFIEEPLRGLPTLFSGHSQMYACTPSNSGTRGQSQRDQETDYLG